VPAGARDVRPGVGEDGGGRQRLLGAAGSVSSRCGRRGHVVDVADRDGEPAGEREVSAEGPGPSGEWSSSWASSWAIRRSAKRTLERAACSRSCRVRLSRVSWRTRCLRVVFSLVIRPMAWGVHSPSASRACPHEGGNAVALGADLGVRGPQRGLGVEGAFPPGRLLPGVSSGGGLGALPGAAGGRGGDQGSGVGVFVEEGA
jgi:hypothetical protein